MSDENRKKHGAETPKDGGSDAEPNGSEKPAGNADRRESVSPDARFPIVGIGASAGGLEALRDFFGTVPAGSGMAFVVIQHLDPTHKSHMVDVLVKHTDMSVLQAKQGTRVEANTVYLIPPNAYMTVRDCELHLEEPIKRAGLRMPIDFFFRSLAEDQQERSICVVLSGSGSDGMLGVRAIRGAGGMAMVQDPDTAAHDSMPRRAIATGLVDYVLPVREMPAALVSYVRQSYLHGQRPPEGAAPEAPADVGTILNLLLVRANSDFRGYKKGTVLRRIQRRMGLSQTASLVDYVRLLRQDPEEASRLAKDMLVGVTGFFRDPEAFDELRRQAVIPLVSGKVDDSGLRAWIPGCATGEEAYSIAIMLLEELSNAGKVAPVQIFASDIDEEALEFGRSGIYPESIASDVSAERLERFFTRHDHTYQVNKEVRECVLFAAQNLITGPPFSKLDLISCRNVLIYLEPEVQRRVSSLFAFALRPGRYLLLGKSDSLADKGKIFEPVSKRWRIYRRTAVPHHEVVEFPVRARGQLVPNAPVETAGARHDAALAAVNQQVLLEHFGAAVVLIDAAGQIAHFHGTTSRYLQHPSGTAGLNVFDMVWDGLSRRLRHSVRRALESKEAVRLEGVPLTREGDDRVDVTVRPVVQPGGVEPLLALFFEEKAGSEPLAAAVEAESAEDIPLVQHLERELGAAREELQASSEEFETTNEELRAAHEEAMSVNEELQSTNEELETSKEELQSVNEELTTVNNQLSDKIEELDAANSDLANLMGSTDVATVFFDRELRVRRFTAPATKVLNLISSDVGRPIRHISQNFAGVDLAAEAKEVLAELVPAERDVRTPDGEWFTMRILPYRDLNDRIDGVVATFAGVTRIKEAEAAAEAARVYAEGIVETVREPLLVLDGGLRVVSANRSFYESFQVSPADTERQLIYALGDGQWDMPELRRLLDEIIPQHREFQDFEVEHDVPGIGHRSMLLNARQIDQPGDVPELILLAIEDVTVRRQAEDQRQRLVELERSRAELANTLTGEISHRTKNNLAMVAGLLEMQADKAPVDGVTREALRDAVARIRGFAVLHELMYGSRSESTDVLACAMRMAEAVRQAHKAADIDISVTGDSLVLPAEPATNVCAVLNELITNAVKHCGQGAAGKRQVRIQLALEEGRLVTDVWDSGDSLPDDFDQRTSAGMGLHLVTDLVERHYGGSFSLRSHDGGTLARAVLEEEQLRRGQDA